MDLETSRDSLSVILAPQFEVPAALPVDPPMLFCLDIRESVLTPKVPVRWVRAKLTLVGLDGTEITDPANGTLRDFAKEKREWWTWPDFVRPGQTLMDAKDDELNKIYFRFDDIAIPTVGIFRFQVTVEEDLGHLGAPDGCFKEIATICTCVFYCAPTSSPKLKPGTLPRYDSVQYLPALRRKGVCNPIMTPGCRDDLLSRRYLLTRI